MDGFNKHKLEWLTSHLDFLSRKVLVGADEKEHAEKLAKAGVLKT